jgi:anti-anti-sigma factor
MTISPYLAITTEQHGQQLVLRLQGELDVSNVDSLRQVLDGLLERAPQTLVVALAGLGFADCAGLSVFLAARTRLAAQGHQLILMNAQPGVGRLLAVTGLDTVFRLSDSGGTKTTPPRRLPHEHHCGPSGPSGGTCFRTLPGRDAIRLARLQAHSDPDRRATGIAADLGKITKLVDHPQAVAVPVVGTGSEPGKRIFDFALVVDLAQDFIVGVPDVGGPAGRCVTQRVGGQFACCDHQVSDPVGGQPGGAGVAGYPLPKLTQI